MTSLKFSLTKQMRDEAELLGETLPDEEATSETRSNEDDDPLAENIADLDMNQSET